MVRRSTDPGAAGQDLGSLDSLLQQRKLTATRQLSSRARLEL